MPRLTTKTRVTLLVHYREARKPTNTGLLAARCVEGSHVCVVGQVGGPVVLPVLGQGDLPLLLFPGEDAMPIEAFAGSERPVTLFVPDGNWRQAGKMRKRVPGLAGVQCVTLPDAGASAYRLRAEPRSGGLATLEAIARALGILEGEGGKEVEEAMLGVFRVMVERTLWLRGSLRSEQVTGGIPEAAVRVDPRGIR